MEGGENLLIQTNIIIGNNDGIVMLHSDGIVQGNKIFENERCGIYLLSETKAQIENNTIENNKAYGIDIKDPSLPEMTKNKI